MNIITLVLQLLQEELERMTPALEAGKRALINEKNLLRRIYYAKINYGPGNA
jgi:hypothetical protein